VTFTEECCDAGGVAGEGPELARRWAADDGVAADAPARDEIGEFLEGESGSEGVAFGADLPGAHGVLCGLAREGFKEAFAAIAARGFELGVAAIGAEGECGSEGRGVVG